MDGLPLLPTTFVGSYPRPSWFTHQLAGRDIWDAFKQRAHQEAFEDAVRTTLKDQEQAGVDVVSDGELRRDNDVDYFLARMPGVEIPHLAKAHYYDYYEAVARHPIPEDGPSLGLADDFRFTREYTDRPIKFSFTGPLSLAKRVRCEASADEAELVMAFARVLNREARSLAAAGATLLQIDEPFLAGHRDQVDLAVRAINTVVEGVDVHWAVHVCYGNRYARPSWEGHYDFLFPAVLEARVDQLVLEFARKGYDDLELFRRYRVPFVLGLGVIDVKSRDLETPDLVAARVRRALQVLPADRVVVNPDCGLRHLPTDLARAKLRAPAPTWCAAR